MFYLDVLSSIGDAMIRIESIEQYYNLIYQAKETISNYISNNYLMSSAVESYISKDMLFYDVTESCLKIYLFQGRYYVLYLIISPNSKVEHENTALPIVSGVIYNSNEEVEKWDYIFLNSGFRQGSILQEVSYNPETVKKNVSITAESIIDSLSSEGFKLVPADVSKKPFLDSFVLGIEEIPFWDVPFRTEEAFKSDCNSGLVNLIVDKSDIICAANYSFIQGKNEYGWIAVDKKYRDLYGMSLALIKAKVDGIISRGHMGRGWIDINNKKSIRFHTGIGEVLTQRYKKNYVFQ